MTLLRTFLVTFSSLVYRRDLEESIKMLGGEHSGGYLGLDPRSAVCHFMTLS